jgi:hypothetical protein
MRRLTRAGPALAAALLAAAAAAGDGTGRVHTLRPGESVWRLTRRYGSDSDAVVAANRIDDAHRLPVGLRLLIPPRSPLGEADLALGLALAELRRARFDEAREAATRARDALAHEAAPDGVRSAEVELVAATVELAYGREDSARTRLGQALRAHPGLRLDPDTAPPRLLRLLDQARSAASEEAPP